CSWHGLAQAAVFTGAGNGFRLGVKTRTWQGAAAGAAGGLVIGGVGYGATCWW
ncbi:TPA: ComC/BlpC family peptide pheromone/bacteriocin, partial [Streptococcus pyogenes]|nr:ComC/BlpC family peptide pheromone/bacteriocin [Streptococcus pyogenes]